MLRNRFFNILVFVLLLIVVALTAREAFATASLVSHPDTVMACSRLAIRSEIHASSEAGTRMTYVRDVPTGVEGGLIQLLSDFRSCAH